MTLWKKSSIPADKSPPSPMVTQAVPGLSAVLTLIIYCLLHGHTLPDALQTAKALLVKQPDHKETLMALEMAIALASSDNSPSGAIRQLGEGWIAEEALAIFCVLCSESRFSGRCAGDGG